MHAAHRHVHPGALLAGMAVGFFMAGVVHAQSNTSGGAPASLQEGLRIMTDRSTGNCIACHALPGTAGVASTFGPTLAMVGGRYSAAELRQWVSDARKIKPDTLMPPFGTTQGTQQAARQTPILTEDQITQVVAALQALR